MRRARARRIAVLAAPIVGGMISQNALQLVDAAMVGALGTTALAGVGLAAFPFFVSFALLLGLAPAVQALAARRLGEGQVERAGEGLHHALLVGLVVAVPAMLLLGGLAPAFFRWMHDDPAVRAHAVPYFQVRTAAIAAIAVEQAFRGFWNGVQRPSVHFVSMLVVHVLNIVLSYGLIFGVAGLPELGSTGAGVGSAVATWVGVGVQLAFGLSVGRGFGFLRAWVAPTRAALAPLLKVFLPAGLQELLFALGLTAFFWIIGRLGTAEVAAGMVIIQVTMVAVLPGAGLGHAAASLVGEALGRGDPDDARRWGWDVVLLGVASMAVLGLPMLLLPDAILRVFLYDDLETIALARVPLQLVGATVGLDAVGLVLMNGLLGAGDARSVAAVVVVFQVLLFLPAAWIVGPLLGFGLLGIALAQVGQRLGQALAFVVIWQRGRWTTVEL